MNLFRKHKEPHRHRKTYGYQWRKGRGGGINQEFEISNYITTIYKTDILQHCKSTSIKKAINTFGKNEEWQPGEDSEQFYQITVSLIFSLCISKELMITLLNPWRVTSYFIFNCGCKSRKQYINKYMEQKGRHPWLWLGHAGSGRQLTCEWGTHLCVWQSVLFLGVLRLLHNCLEKTSLMAGPSVPLLSYPILSHGFFHFSNPLTAFSKEFLGLDFSNGQQAFSSPPLPTPAWLRNWLAGQSAGSESHLAP